MTWDPKYIGRSVEQTCGRCFETFRGTCINVHGCLDAIKHGNVASNIPVYLARAKGDPRKLADEIVSAIAGTYQPAEDISQIIECFELKFWTTEIGVKIMENQHFHGPNPETSIPEDVMTLVKSKLRDRGFHVEI